MVEAPGFERFAVGDELVMTERWRGLLWSAIPGRVVARASDELAVWVPRGTPWVVATNRHLREAAGLDRESRKLLALRTGRAEAVEATEELGRLLVYRAGRWSCVYLAWEPDGRFIGWYVNLERPVTVRDGVLVSKDLVLDVVAPAAGGWRWKDRDDFARAIAQGVVDETLRRPLEAEAMRCVAELEAGESAFAPRWRDLELDPAWPVPRLPERYAWGGSAWSLPAGPVRAVE